MVRLVMAASALTLAGAPQLATAQQVAMQTISGTRLDVSATGEVTRVPDVARISAGVVTQAASATAAITQNAEQMTSVRSALRRAGIADRDIQTSQISLNPEYRYVENRPPVLTGYRASNEVSVRFRDVANTGKILDALVAQGANQINGPMLMLDRPEEALDQARTSALRIAQARAELYAKAVGKRVTRILSISESGGYQPVPRPMAMEARGMGDAAQSKIDPGEQAVTVTLSVSFELE
jgi:uncharacterized protein YggE